MCRAIWDRRLSVSVAAALLLAIGLCADPAPGQSPPSGSPSLDTELPRAYGPPPGDRFNALSVYGASGAPQATVSKPFSQWQPSAGNGTAAGSADRAEVPPYDLNRPAISPSPFDSPAAEPRFVPSSDDWRWQMLPRGILYPSYLAGVKEPRMGTQALYTGGYGWLWDTVIGGRMGIIRYGSSEGPRSEGWQLDVEAAAFPRLDVELEREFTACDFRAGVPITYRCGIWETKLAYYHLCSHLGDQYQLDHPNYHRNGYIRDCTVLGIAVRPWENVRLYNEVGYAWATNGPAKPWELQFGAEYSSTAPSGFRVTPFAAVNAYLRQDNDFSGNITFEAGIQWRDCDAHLLRFGLLYFNGLSEQYQFFTKHEDQIGLGLWYDF